MGVLSIGKVICHRYNENTDKYEYYVEWTNNYIPVYIPENLIEKLEE
jgi:hypothetical protein